MYILIAYNNDTPLIDNPSCIHHAQQLFAAIAKWYVIVCDQYQLMVLMELIESKQML